MRRLLIASLTALVLAAVPAARAGEEAPPSARAWLVRVALPGTGDLIAIADTGAIAGAAPRSSASPVAIGGQDPLRATADLAARDSVKTFETYDDPTGSMRLELGVSEAHATPDGASSRAAFGAMSGSGFALANELFTFEQQAELLGQWQQTMDAIFVPLNDALSTLGGPLGLLGLKLPALSGISPAGLVDVARARQAASTAQVALSPGFSSARAEAAAADVRLFGGFIEAKGVGAEAVSEDQSGTETRTATARVGSLSIAGIAVEADGDGFRVAGNDLVSRTALQPALELLLGSLEKAGVEVRLLDSRGTGNVREATALQVRFASPAGDVLVSVGAARASAPAAPPLPSEGDGAGGTDDDPVVLGESFEERPPALLDVPAVEPASVATAPRHGASAGGPLYRRPGPAAARALRTAYLLVMLGAVAASIGYPLSIRRAGRRRAALLAKGARP